jgi:two-component system, cell cycle sensor histidine kinase and response regulator CckA
VPIGYQLQVYGWLCLVNKLGSDAFSEVDERLAVTLAAQMAVAHENAQLFSNIQHQATDLAQEVAERKHHEAVLRSSEQRYRDLIAGSIQGITIYRNFTPLLVNRAFANIFRYTPEEILAMETITTRLAPQEHNRLGRYHEARLRGESAPQRYEFQGL